MTTLATAPAVRRPAVPLARRRRSALDGVRGCAVAGVLLAHLGIPYLHGGAVGVDVFFVLSGYLITGLLLDEASRRGRISLRNFWLRRGARLLPALLLLVAVNTAWALTTSNHRGAHESLHALPWVLGYAGNWVKAFSHHDLAVYGHTWSLALEEQFYLLWPIALVVWTRSRSTRALVPVLSVACVLGTLVRLVEWPGFAGMHRIYGTDYLADQVLVGCLLAVVLHTGRRPALLVRTWSRRASAIGVAVLLAMVVLLDPSRSSWQVAVFCTVGFTAVALAAAAVIARVEIRPADPLARALSVRPLAALGRISYGVYLLHIPVFAVVRERTHLSPPVRWGVEVGAALLVAAVSYRLLELPCLRIKDRWAL